MAEEWNEVWNDILLYCPQLVRARDAVRIWFNTGASRWALHKTLGSNALVLSGPTGVGKTHFAKIIQRAFGPVGLVAWSELELVTALWDSWQSPKAQSDRWMIDQCRNARLFVLDDLGAAHVGAPGWLFALYWRLFDYDAIKGRGGVLITTNLSWPNFRDRVGSRAASRLVHLLGGIDEERDRPRAWVGAWCSWLEVNMRFLFEKGRWSYWGFCDWESNKIQIVRELWIEPTQQLLQQIWSIECGWVRYYNILDGR